MKVVDKKLTELTPYANNPRKNDDAVQYVANSIKEFGFKVPIVIDKDGVIVAGHTRYKAAKQLKLNTVPCVVADDLSPEEIREFRLIDNKVGEKSLWNWNVLSRELDEKTDWTMFGFSTDEISAVRDIGTSFTPVDNNDYLDDDDTPNANEGGSATSDGDYEYEEQAVRCPRCKKLIQG